MDLRIILEIFTVIIAIYGAAVTTILALRKISKERRKVLVVLKRYTSTKNSQVRVVNQGPRPATITDVRILFRTPGSKYYKGSSGGWLKIPSSDNKSLPVTINDGEQAIISLPSEVTHMLENRDVLFKAAVYDAEGNEHWEYSVRQKDRNWNDLNKIERRKR